MQPNYQRSKHFRGWKQQLMAADIDLALTMSILRRCDCGQVYEAHAGQYIEPRSIELFYLLAIASTIDRFTCEF